MLHDAPPQEHTTPPTTPLSLGDKGMLAAYLSAASRGLLNQSYSNLLLAQQALSLDNVDSDLVVKSEAYQSQMRAQARYYIQAILPGLITVMTHGSNFYALTNALNGLLRQEDNQTILNRRNQLADQVESMAEQAQSYQIDAQALNDRLQVASRDLSPLMVRYQEVLNQLEQGLSDETKRLTQNVNDLNKAIAANIQGIIDEGGKAGEGVSQLGQAIVASLKLETKKEDPDKPAKTPKDPAADGSSTANEQTQYMISGITAIKSGIAGASQAAKELRATTDKLAQAYLALSAVHSMLSVAKSVQAQNQLFVDSYLGVAQAVALLPDNWKRVAEAFQAAVPVMANLSSFDDVKQLKTSLTLATQQWQFLSQQVDDIKAAYAGNGVLPNAQ